MKIIKTKNNLVTNVITHFDILYIHERPHHYGGNIRNRSLGKEKQCTLNLNAYNVVVYYYS